MPKSDDTRYASEIPTLHSWDPTIQTIEVKNAIVIAMATRQNEYNANIIKAKAHRDIIITDMMLRGYNLPKTFSWQANNNRNSNGSPADIVFMNHELGGVSVKDGSDIIGNFGTNDFDVKIERPIGEDLFRHLASSEFDTLLLKVKRDLLATLSVGETWTKDRADLDYGKYSVTRSGTDEYKLKFKTSIITLTHDQILTEKYYKKDTEKKVAGRFRRVFGDYYQEENNKKLYLTERNALYAVLYPKVCSLFEMLVRKNDDKLCTIGGFTKKPYYVSDLKNNHVYFVPPMDDVQGKLSIEIFDKDKEKSFGSGFELGCEIKLDSQPSSATLDFYICYNSGTFNRGPVIKIQNFKRKENLWTRIH
jgi:hypothetical protein